MALNPVLRSMKTGVTNAERIEHLWMIREPRRALRPDTGRAPE
jgi:hypothetical protein